MLINQDLIDKLKTVSQSPDFRTPKRGWHDVIVHGSDDGMNFIINGEKVTANQLYIKTLEDGCQQETRIRLVSCNSDALKDGGAAQLSKLTNAMVVAPTKKVMVAGPESMFLTGKMLVLGGGKFKVFLPNAPK